MFDGIASGNVRQNKPTYIVRSTTNQRATNEDSFQLFSLIPVIGQPLITILTVADGMGGHAHGAEVSREALRKVSLALFEQLTVERSLNHLEEAPPVDPPSLSQALFSALEQANAHVKRMVEANNWVKAGNTFAKLRG
ncbi:hypothetical protein [Iningainema tapete]|uniref:PPM-type phosphatase domain-containing protein n=1 Tax=Iningainema tapete BLCC-T55 TaxID=2748662 RepID=A0A8J7BWX4_9CYAN|nr:hypothetical protein [Iningainema tapete]MBD2771783.1 hypothetical protein [Iningainema tapete BLCC-T55]